MPNEEESGDEEILRGCRIDCLGGHRQRMRRGAFMKTKKCHLAAAIKNNPILRKLVHSDFNGSFIVRIRYDKTVAVHDGNKSVLHMGK